MALLAMTLLPLVLAVLFLTVFGYKPRQLLVLLRVHLSRSRAATRGQSFSGPRSLLRELLLLLHRGRSAQLSKQSMRLLASAALILATLLYATFAPAAMSTLDHIDALVFLASSALLLVPVASVLLFTGRRWLSQTLLLRGLLLGGCLCGAFLCLTWSFKRVGMLETVLFMSLNGLAATGIAVFVLRQRLRWPTKLACLCSCIGMALIWLTSFGHWQGNVTALVGGSLMTISAFLVERLLVPEVRRQPRVLWPVLGVQMLTLAGGSLLVAWCFGDWSTLRGLQPRDGLVLLYTSIGTTFLPLVLANWSQQYVNAVTVAFLGVLGPLVTTASALLMGERLPALSSVGGAIILIGILVQMGGAGNTEAPKTVVSAPRGRQPLVRTVVQQRQQKRKAVLLELLVSVPEGVDLSTLVRWTGASRTALYQELLILRGRGAVVKHPSRLYALAPSCPCPRPVQPHVAPSVERD